MSTIWRRSAPEDGVAKPYSQPVTSNRKERRAQGVLHLRASWGSDGALCGRIGAWSEAVLDQSLATCRRCIRIDAIAIEARQRTDREDGLDPKGESAGPQDIAQRRSR